jgi:hypothetical protein
MSTLVIQGTVLELPAGGVGKPFDKRLALARDAEIRTFTLTSDSPVAVSLDGWTGLNAIHLESDTKITALITSADGTAQAIPVDDLLSWICRAVPITGLSLQRVSGQNAIVKLTLGQKA